jgi:hypothetical protein
MMKEKETRKGLEFFEPFSPPLPGVLGVLKNVSFCIRFVSDFGFFAAGRIS